MAAPRKLHGSTPFGDRLKKTRTEKGMGIHELAAACDLPVCRITGYENRGVKPRFDSLMKLCAVLDCSLEWLCEVELGQAYKEIDIKQGLQSE